MRAATSSALPGRAIGMALCSRSSASSGVMPLGPADVLHGAVVALGPDGPRVDAVHRHVALGVPARQVFAGIRHGRIDQARKEHAVGRFLPYVPDDVDDPPEFIAGHHRGHGLDQVQVRYEFPIHRGGHVAGIRDVERAGRRTGRIVDQHVDPAEFPLGAGNQLGTERSRRDVPRNDGHVLPATGFLGDFFQRAPSARAEDRRISLGAQMQCGGPPDSLTGPEDHGHPRHGFSCSVSGLGTRWYLGGMNMLRERARAVWGFSALCPSWLAQK